ncbi:MAG: hypothetical protein KJN67_04440 [Pontiella sp.]|nr:hypothetical protein [Pontiella sp.]
MDQRKARALLSGIKVGDTIKAHWLNQIVQAVNENTRGVMAPRQKITSTTGDGAGIYAPPGSPGPSAGDESFKAYADDITSTTETFTDDNGDDVDIEVITEIEFIETSSGRKITLTIDYDNNRPT